MSRKILAAVTAIVALAFSQGCSALYSVNIATTDCNGMWTYDANEWAPEEIATMRSAVSKINAWMGSETVYLHKALPEEENGERCMIRPSDKIVYQGDTKAGLCMHTTGNIEIAAKDMHATFEPEAVMPRMESVMAHELLHGIGFEHVEAEGNVMYKSSGMTLAFGKEDNAQCHELGFCQ